jgi:hypothetical protein
MMSKLDGRHGHVSRINQFDPQWRDYFPARLAPR